MKTNCKSLQWKTEIIVCRCVWKPISLIIHEKLCFGVEGRRRFTSMDCISGGIEATLSLSSIALENMQKKSIRMTLSTLIDYVQAAFARFSPSLRHQTFIFYIFLLLFCMIFFNALLLYRNKLRQCCSVYKYLCCIIEFASHIDLMIRF